MGACPCGLKQTYAECCEPIIAGNRLAETAEQVMRARYSAFAKQKFQFIEDSHHPKTRHELNKEEIEKWSSNAEWQGLDILGTRAGGQKDQEGLVEFVAHYAINGQPVQHREVSEFKRDDGKWYFYDGKPVPQTYRRAAPKVGRNDPCACGSGKKFKHCCA